MPDTSIDAVVTPGVAAKGKDEMDILRWLFDATIQIGSSQLLVREVLGNIFGLLSALSGMRRKVWAWPVGIVGNVLLLTVFVGSVFGDADTANLLGQAGRQIMFVAVSVYGWRQWSGRNTNGRALVPRWATARERGFLITALILGTVALTPLFRTLGSYEPVWADAWTFMGSLLATYGMARGLVEFWLIWVAVDVVGVPLLFSAGYYATAVMYLFYGLFTLVGFFVWMRARNASVSGAVEAFSSGSLVRR
ncbi:nicotinamide mononucleotide transporter [Arthrobacter roseus]|nr:nicotinamide mononucleotide transporter [Arthrobacter roseus]